MDRGKFTGARGGDETNVAMTESVIEITVNGERRGVRSGATLADLLRELELNPKFLAVERNLEVVPRTHHAACRLQADDALEIVTLVGGG
jgi:thiamine biosynthesis protein ThiS